MPGGAHDPPHPFQRLNLELANPLASDAELRRHLSSSRGISAVKTVTAGDYVATAGRHDLQQPADEKLVLLGDERLKWICDAVVDEFSGKGLAGLVIEGSVERSAVLSDAPQRLKLGRIDAHRLLHVSVAWMTTENRGQVRLGAPQLRGAMPGRHGYAHLARLVSQCPVDRLTHVPDGERGELHSVAFVEPSERTQDSDHPLLDEVVEWDPVVAVADGDATDHGELRLHQPFQRERLAGTCSSNDLPLPPPAASTTGTFATLESRCCRHGLGLPWRGDAVQ
jgi:hypothetical protein